VVSKRKRPAEQAPTGQVAGVSRRGADGSVVSRASAAAPTRWTILLVLAGIAVYLVLFYRTPLEGVTWIDPGGAPASRLAAVVAYLDPGLLWSLWTGDDAGQISVLDRAGVLLAVLLILLVAQVLGRLLLELLRAEAGLTPLERFTFSAAVGLQLVSLLVLAAGLAGWLHRPLGVALPLVVLLVYAGRRWRGSWSAASAGAGPLPVAAGACSPQDGRGLGRLGWVLAAPLLVVIVLGGMLPPWDFDVREYHLQVPQEWYQQGRITFLPHNVYGNMPLGAEMHALLAMVLLPVERAWWWGALVGKTVMAAYAPLTALVLLAAGRRLATPLAGGVAAVVYLATPWVAKISVSGLNEVALGFFFVTACHAVLLWRLTERSQVAREKQQGAASAPGWHAAAGGSAAGLLLLSGFLAGASVSCKYTAALLVVPVVVALTVRKDRLWRVRPAAIVLLGVAISCGPWLVKNWVLTGNPVYPLLYRVFDGRTRTAENNAQWLRAHRVPLDPSGARYSPGQLAKSVSRLAWRSPWLSPLLLPLAALAVARPATRRWALPWLAILAWYFSAWWLVTHRVDRFWVPALPIWALLAGVGATWNEGRAWRNVLLGLLSATTLGSWVLVASPVAGTDPRLLVALDALRTDALRVNPVHLELNRLVPAGKRVLLVGDAQPFDLEVGVLYNTCFDASIFQRLVEGRSPTEAAHALAAARVSHIYYDRAEVARYQSPGNYGYTAFVTDERFDQLVRAGVLEPVELPTPRARGTVYRVLGPSDRMRATSTRARTRARRTAVASRPRPSTSTAAMSTSTAALSTSTSTGEGRGIRSQPGRRCAVIPRGQVHVPGRRIFAG